MKKIILSISLNLLMVLIADAQEVDKNLLYGNWIGEQTGAPGRTIKQNDSTFVSNPPVTYSITTIKLKRFGRLVKRTNVHNGIGIDSELKGKWKINGDTLSLQFKQLEEMYLIDQSVEERIFFKSLNSGRFVYSRKE